MTQPTNSTPDCAATDEMLANEPRMAVGRPPSKMKTGESDTGC